MFRFGGQRITLGEGASMLARKFADYSRYAMLPFLLVVFGGATYLGRGTALAKAFPYYHSFILLFAMITIERVYAYSRAVSQRHMIWRDLMSTAVQAFVAAAVLGAMVLPVLRYFPTTFLGRRFLFGISDQLGPLWVQVLVVFLLTACFGTRSIASSITTSFLWKLHGYHHSVTTFADFECAGLQPARLGAAQYPGRPCAQHRRLQPDCDRIRGRFQFLWRFFPLRR